MLVQYGVEYTLSTHNGQLEDTTHEDLMALAQVGHICMMVVGSALGGARRRSLTSVANSGASAATT